MKYINKLLQLEKDQDPASLDDKQYYYLQTEWLDDAIKLLVLDTKTQQCFKGEISIDIMREVGEQLDLEYDAFMAECKQALITNIGLPGFTYKIDYNELVFQAFKHDKFETQFMDIPLRVVRNQYELLDAAIEHIVEEKELPQATTTNASSFDEAQFQKDFNELKQIIENNKEIETVLIRKFAFILKKKEQEIEKLQKANKLLKYKAAVHTKDVNGELDEEDDEVYFEATQPMTQVTSNSVQNRPTRNRRQIIDTDDEEV